MQIGFEVTGAKSKKDEPEQATQEPMRPTAGPRRNPSTDQLKARRLLTRTAAGESTTCMDCGGPVEHVAQGWGSMQFCDGCAADRAAKHQSESDAYNRRYPAGEGPGTALIEPQNIGLLDEAYPGYADQRARQGVRRQGVRLHKHADSFWDAVGAQYAELKSAKTADDVLAILSNDRNPYGDSSMSAGQGFWAGSGGDENPADALHEAGWRINYIEGEYHWEATPPGGGPGIEYVEGDIYRKTASMKRQAFKIEDVQKIVDTQTFGSVDGQPLDTFSASAILAVYNALKDDANRQKLLSFSVGKAAEVCFKMLNKKGSMQRQAGDFDDLLYEVRNPVQGPHSPITDSQSTWTLNPSDDHWIGNFTDTALDEAFRFWTGEGRNAQPNLPGYADSMTKMITDERTRRGGSMNREAQILAALPKASPTEQVRLASELEMIRSARRTAAHDRHEHAMGSQTAAIHLTPVFAHVHHSSATDWLAAEAPDRTAPEHIVQAARAEATVWSRRVHAAVREDREEFMAQATGYASTWAGRYGMDARTAAAAFVDWAAHLGGFRREAGDKGPAWFEDNVYSDKGPHSSGAPGGGIPIRGPLSDEQEAWMNKGRSKSKADDEDDVMPKAAGYQSGTSGKLQCDGRKDCGGEVTHIHSNGWAYCANCASRLGGRKMTKGEIKTLEGGGTISYRRGSAHTADQGMGPSDDSQSGFAETGLDTVDVDEATKDTNMGWIGGTNADDQTFEDPGNVTARRRVVAETVTLRNGRTVERYSGDLSARARYLINFLESSGDDVNRDDQTAELIDLLDAKGLDWAFGPGDMIVVWDKKTARRRTAADYGKDDPDHNGDADGPNIDGQDAPPWVNDHDDDNGEEQEDPSKTASMPAFMRQALRLLAGDAPPWVKERNESDGDSDDDAPAPNDKDDTSDDGSEPDDDADDADMKSEQKKDARRRFANRRALALDGSGDDEYDPQGPGAEDGKKPAGAAPMVQPGDDGWEDTNMGWIGGTDAAQTEFTDPGNVTASLREDTALFEPVVPRREAAHGDPYYSDADIEMSQLSEPDEPGCPNCGASDTFVNRWPGKENEVGAVAARAGLSPRDVVICMDCGAVVDNRVSRDYKGQIGTISTTASRRKQAGPNDWYIIDREGGTVFEGPFGSEEEASAAQAAGGYNDRTMLAQGFEFQDWDFTASQKTAMPAPADVGVEMGSIFYSSWGYDQTNVSFYQVVRLMGASVSVREVAKDREYKGSGSTYVTPRKDEFIGAPMTKRLQSSGYKGAAITISSSETAWLWDGKPQYETESGWGH